MSCGKMIQGVHELENGLNVFTLNKNIKKRQKIAFQIMQVIWVYLSYFVIAILYAYTL